MNKHHYFFTFDSDKNVFNLLPSISLFRIPSVTGFSGFGIQFSLFVFFITACYRRMK